MDSSKKDSKTDADMEAHLITHPDGQSYRLTNMRYVALSLACCLLVGSYYSYDNPSALETPFTKSDGDFGLSNVNYNLLYSVYSFPNIILPLFGGILIDRMGIRIGVILFSFLLIIGQFFFMLGGIMKSYGLLILGRVIFGLGGESLSVTQSTLVAKWFGDKELAFALGLNIAVSRLGSTVNTALTPRLYDGSGGFFLPLFVGLILCCVSFVSGLGLCWMDREADRREGKLKGGANEPDESDQIKFSDLKNFNSTFWLLTLNCMLIYGAFFSFTGNANDLLNAMFGVSNNTAGLYLMIIYLIAACITPFFGKITDKYGQRASMMIFPLSLFVVAMVVLIFYPSDINGAATLFPLICTGIFYSTYAAIFWPCIALVVEKRTLGTAYGIVTSVQNLNLAISPLIFGAIHDKTVYRGGYFWAVVFVIFQAVIGLYCAVAINVVDFKNGNTLDKVNKLNKVESAKASRQSILR